MSVTALGGGALAAAALYALLARAWPLARPLPRERLRSTLVRAGLLVVFAAREELLWRWVVLGAGSTLVDVPAAFAVSTFGFALAHRQQAGWRSIAVHSFTGSVFGGAYLVAGGVVAAITAHATYNLLVLAAAETRRAEVPP